MDADDFLSRLKSVLPPSTSLAMVHSSLPHLAPTGGLDKWTVLRGMDRLADSGMTLAIPAFTFSFTRGEAFDRLASPSETGILADWVLQLSGADRTSHPIYSFVVLGPLRDEILACHDATIFGDNSIFGYFERHQGRVAMLGCGWEYATQFHRYEEEGKVPYRYFKTFSGIVRDHGSETHVDASMFVRDLELDPQNDFSPIIQQLRSEGQILTTQYGRGTMESALVGDMARVARAMIDRDPWVFAQNARRLEYAAKQRESRRVQAPLKVAVLGHANVEMFETYLRETLTEHISNQSVETMTVPYGQVAQQILDDASKLNQFQADFTFFVDRLEDLLGVPNLEVVSEHDPSPADRVEPYVALIKAYREKNRGLIVVHPFCSLTTSVYGAAAASVTASSTSIVAQLDADLRGALSDVEQLHVFDLALAAVEHSESVLDARLWFLGRFPYSASFTRHLAKRYTGIILAATGRSARLIVLDLDNTLWGGILGEDGLAGLKLGGDYPGNTHAAFQRILKKLSQRGIALAVCSKNDEAHAIAAMDEHPNMAIRSSDLVAWRINWVPKHQNVREISQQLNLGLESVLFVDDNPVEREQMRQQLPAVKVLDLPADPTHYTQALLDSPWLDSLRMTKEDFQRVEGYKARSQVEQLRGQFSSLDSFYASLGIQLFLQAVDDRNMDRALQLIQKTNQFNATTRRHVRGDLEQFLARGDDVIAIGVEDRFNTLETMGVLIARWNYPHPRAAWVDSYLLSCRVLGKGIETGVIQWLKRHAQQRGMEVLWGEVRHTDRNEPVRGVFEKSGFAKHGTHYGLGVTWTPPDGDASGGEVAPPDSLWKCDLVTGHIEIPSWLSIHDELEVEIPR